MISPKRKEMELCVYHLSDVLGMNVSPFRNTYENLKPKTCSMSEKTGKAVVQYNKSKISEEDIIKSINATSYKVVKQ